MSRFLDPDGREYGIPTWPWRMAPQHLRTKRQLAQRDQRPIEREPQAQVMRSRRGKAPMVAHLYDAEKAVPKRTPSEAQLAALQVARWTRSVAACERRGIDASDMREVIEQARADLAARRRATSRGRKRSRTR
ncbi:RRQRL motif-containing zinc-binding protein [Nocardia sp. NPDC052316]|uniref:RRQRL motif-containing zinc-binding protein n=1 Tax=Nocardia sp. NPDC052316 TaxID=3364329 RepID=UPI0037CAF0FF